MVKRLFPVPGHQVPSKFYKHVDCVYNSSHDVYMFNAYTHFINTVCFNAFECANVLKIHCAQFGSVLIHYYNTVITIQRMTK